MLSDIFNYQNCPFYDMGLTIYDGPLSIVGM